MLGCRGAAEAEAGNTGLCFQLLLWAPPLLLRLGRAPPAPLPPHPSPFSAPLWLCFIPALGGLVYFTKTQD